MMTQQHHARLVHLLLQLAAPRFAGRVSDWCCDNVRFREPNCTGPFTFAGREYLRQPLDDWGSTAITDEILCFGTRTGKTRTIFGGLAWMLVNEPSRVLYVMPNTHGTGGAQNVSRTRWQPMLKASPELETLIPTGAQRHQFKTLQQILGGSIIDWAGSNSPANLASNPARVVIQDEIDKYRRLGDKEADPSKLADERCKEFSNPKRFKSSTPTLVSGLIWQELMKSDLKRRFLPCPHCGKHVVFAWSEQYTVLPKLGCEAYIRWDRDARKLSGDWDLDRVERSAHALCPHCRGRIQDTHKTRMDRGGEWRATQTGAPGYSGYHLPSMYAASVQTNFGKMAVRFLTSKRSIAGLQGFINSDLAEPYISQDTIGERTELITAALDATSEWQRLLTVDYQAKAPHFWYVARAWSGANSEAYKAGSCDTFDDLRAIQKSSEVKDPGVFIDSGHGTAEIYRECAASSLVHPQPIGLPLLVGWTPTKGQPGHKRWKDEESELLVPYFLRGIDPYMGTAEAGRFSMSLFEFSADYFKDILENLRRGKAHHWAVLADVATPEYWRHLDGQHKIAKEGRYDGRIQYVWSKRHRHWPDHLFACEYAQVAAAAFLRFLPIEEKS